MAESIYMKWLTVNHINTDVNGVYSMLTDLFQSIEAVRAIDFLLDNADGEFNKSQLADQAGVSRPTLLYKILPRFKKLGLVKVDENDRFQKIVTLNLDSPLVQSLLKFDNEIADAALDNRLFEEIEGAVVSDEESSAPGPVYRYSMKERGERTWAHFEERILATALNTAERPAMSLSGQTHHRRNQYAVSSTA